jgi:hypothetical protein
MPDYRAFIVGHDGRFQQAIEMVCSDEQSSGPSNMWTAMMLSFGSWTAGLSN